jgi:hypothetical protein
MKKAGKKNPPFTHYRQKGDKFEALSSDFLSSIRGAPAAVESPVRNL